jgi:choice-of-anchor A domain-containing protein
MPRWVVVCVLAALAIVPSRAMAADCAAPGVPGQFDVFAAGAFTANSGGTTIQGRVAAGGNARVQGITLGTNPPLTPDTNRADLIVGGNLTVDGGGGSVPFGRVTYGGALTPTGTLNALGGLHQAQPPFTFADQATTLRERSAQWSGLTANGTISGPTYDTAFTGNDPVRNVFSLTASALEGIGQVTLHVPATSTVLINVAGSFTSHTYTIALNGLPPEQLLWNFSLAQSVKVNSWQGTILAPDAAVSISNGTYNGSVAARDVSISSVAFNDHRFAGCLPPAPPKDLSLASLCTDPLTRHHSLRLRNTGASAHPAHWEDLDSGQSGDLDAPAESDTFFDVLGGDVPHHIVVTSGSTTLQQTTATNLCGGTIVVGKTVTGEGLAPVGPWVIAIKGTNAFSTTRALLAGAQAAVAVPGTFQEGSVPIGEIAGGYLYTISETDPLGGVASVDRPVVTITDDQTERVTVTNDFPPTPTPEPPPTPPPPQPPLPPGPPTPPSGPDLVVAASVADGADLQVAERISPRVTTVGHVVSVTVRVRNLGPLPADAAVVREIPQFDPSHPNQVARILRVTPTVRAASACTTTRPVRCGPATLAVGAEAVVRVRARILMPGAYKSVIMASSATPDPNTTNNIAANGLAVARPVGVAVGVRAPAVARVGEPVAYRVVARGAGQDGAGGVRFCHRPPARLLMTSAPGTFRYRGSVCRDVRRLARGGQASFVVHAIPAASAGGRTLALLATATAANARPAVGTDRIAVIAQTFVGTG